MPSPISSRAAVTAAFDETHTHGAVSAQHLIRGKSIGGGDVVSGAVKGVSSKGTAARMSMITSEMEDDGRAVCLCRKCDLTSFPT